jgi:DNA-binding LacI/PurR family transcriptional regulator
MKSSKDVAKQAGVSQATVSRVLNNPDSVMPETRQKVLKAIEHLGYYPNLIARSLVTNSSRTIALISGSLKNGFFVETTDSIVRLAKSWGYKTIVYFEEEKNRDLMDLIIGNKVDGILLSLIKLDDPVVEQLERTNIPCVFFNRKPRNGGNFVVLDNIMAAKLITRHLLDLGHRRIAYLSGETDVSTFSDRIIGFMEIMREANVEVKAELTHFMNTLNDDIERLTFQLLHMSEPPTAIICATDAMALTCMNAILSIGLRIPEDISLVGIDDISLASHHAIQLTTVGHQNLQMGEIAAKNLFEIMNEESSFEKLRQVTLKPELVIRKSTAQLK